MIVLGADHAGFELKNKLKSKLLSEKYEVIDMSLEYNQEDDYTDVVEGMCNNIKYEDMGIMICGTGIGSCIMANKFKRNKGCNLL